MAAIPLMAHGLLTVGMRRIRVIALLDSLRSSLWFVPAVMTAVAIGASVVMIEIDRRVQVVKSVAAWIYSGGAEGARQVLATVAGSMITVAGVSFSVTMVALSLASSQFGPRLLRNFMRDRGNQFVLGTFIATFVFCLMVLRTVRGENGDGGQFVPSIAVTFGLVLAIGSLAVLIYFIHHLSNLLQAEHVIVTVAAELDATIGRMYPRTGREPDAHSAAAITRFEEETATSEPYRIDRGESGYIVAVDLDELMGIASSREAVIRVPVMPGRYVLDRTTIAEIWPGAAVDEDICRRVRQAIVLGRNRTTHQDLEFAVEQIVEVGARALSPAINDPFTAIACIDRLTTAILHMMDREFPSPYRIDDRRALRLVVSRPDFAGITDAAFNQLRQFGSRMPAVTIRMLESVAFLLPLARNDEQRVALRRHGEMIRRAADRETAEKEDRADVEERFRELDRG